ncbi:hypothetical protein Bca101_068490 [Brassica carinata]
MTLILHLSSMKKEYTCLDTACRFLLKHHRQVQSAPSDRDISKRIFSQGKECIYETVDHVVQIYDDIDGDKHHVYEEEIHIGSYGDLTFSINVEDVEPPDRDGDCFLCLVQQDDLASEHVQVGYMRTQQVPYSRHVGTTRRELLTWGFEIFSLAQQFVRFVQRFEPSKNHILIAKVLSRVRTDPTEQILAKLLQDRVTNLPGLESSTVKLEFLFQILFLELTGVNCIGEVKRSQRVQVTSSNTLGFYSLLTSYRRDENIKMLLSVKRFVKKRPLAIVLYLECFQMENIKDNDFQLLKSITDVVGAFILLYTINEIADSATASNGRDGQSMNYEPFVGQRMDSIHHYLPRATCDIAQHLLVENNHNGKKNYTSEFGFPHVRTWEPNSLFSCVSIAVFGNIQSSQRFRYCINMRQSDKVGEGICEFLHSDLNMEADQDQIHSLCIYEEFRYVMLLKSQKQENIDESESTLYLQEQRQEEL